MSHPSPGSDSALRVVAERAPGTALGRWLHGGGRSGDADPGHATHPWYAVLWLTGVDYFSTLGYQPGIALVAAQGLSPIATAILVLVTLFGALPMYAQVAARSFIGQGSIAMLERLLSGWTSKLFVLALLGFAATGFVITMTLSAADAAKHLIENPFIEHFLKGGQLWVTLVMLAVLAGVFLLGFREAIGVAVAVGVPYILLNLVICIRAASEIARHPEILSRWQEALTRQGDWSSLLVTSALVFPQLALGLSGFETGVSVMPLVSGDPDDDEKPVPTGRVRNTRKLLATAAIMMSILLLATSWVTALLVPQEAYKEGGPASGRVLAYLTHELMGHGWGTLYDVSTILILWFAGASAMVGLLNLVPRYLPRFGMAPQWVSYTRPLVLVLFAITLLVTLVFRADVDSQAGAYATGVLGVLLSGAFAVTVALWREHRERQSAALEAEGVRRSAFPWSVVYFALVTLIFAYTLVENILTRPDGLIISATFILAIVLLSALSRYTRATELRVESITFLDAESEALWRELVCKKVNLVPLKHLTRASMDRKAAEIRQYYTVQGPLAFLHVNLLDDRSEFMSDLRIKVRRRRDEQPGDVLVEVYGATALANTIAYVSELIDPIALFLGLTRQNSVSQALSYLLWGMGETGILVYEILLRHWEETPEEDVRPLIFLMSE
jgi:predicted outer membrane lipoprotein